jgi:hypothetical protein
MVKLVLVGLWACLMTLGSSYGAAYWKVAQARAAAGEHPGQNIEFKKTKEFTVPKISDGTIQGYVIVELSYSLDTGAIKNANAPPEVFLLDEAFRYIYADDTIDFDNMKKYDLQKFTKNLVQSVNARMGGAIVKDVLIQEFNYMTKQDMKKQI